jgi:hypothetical protein
VRQRQHYFATSSSDDGIGACVSRALTKSPATGHLAAIKYSVTIRIDKTPGRTGFRGSGNDSNGYPPVGGLHRSVSACNPMQRGNDGTRRWSLWGRGFSIFSFRIRSGDRGLADNWLASCLPRTRWRASRGSYEGAARPGFGAVAVLPGSGCARLRHDSSVSISRLCIRVGTPSRPRKSGWQRFTGVADSHRAPVPTRAHLRHTLAHPPEGVHPWPPPSPQAPRA